MIGNQFLEVPISEWAKPYVAKAVTSGLMNGMDDGSFNPNGNALREHAFVVVFRILNV